MFGKLFGSKKPQAAPAAKRAAAKPASPPKVKLRRINVQRRFMIIAETGEGSMSRVYRALDNETGRTVCLKIQDKEKTTAAVARSNLAARTLEGAIGMKIVHPHVVRTFEYGETTRNEHYIAMEFIEGVSLTFV